MSFISSILGYSASEDAADAQAEAANNANATTWKIYQQNRKDSAPWRQAGAWSVNQAQNLMQNPNQTIQKDPGYQFRYEQGENALNRSEAAKGKLLSGQALKSASQYGQDYATGQYQNTLNNYMSLAGMGNSSNASTASSGTNTANTMSSNYQYGGNARASGYINQANAITGGINSLFG